jgi:hypothetical protein
MKKARECQALATLLIVIASGCSDEPPSYPQPRNPVVWDVGYVRLQASDFYIEAKGVRYLANVDSVNVGGDPGDDSTRTLELEWTEHSNPMRLYIYFVADSVNWWSDEIRTYDGTVGDGTQWCIILASSSKARGAIRSPATSTW